MPELPDVEGFRRLVADSIAGHDVHDVRVRDGGVLLDVASDEFAQALRGRRIAEPGRHGKWLLLHTDGPAALFHFGMTGALLRCPITEDPHPHDRVVFTLDDDVELRYRDMRKLRGVRLARTEGGVLDALSGLGPDADRVPVNEFIRLLSARRRGVKSALLAQDVLAGLGNLLIDEILWQSRICPRIRTDRLADTRLRALHRTMRRVLRTAIRAGCVPPKPSWLTGVRERPQAGCPRCGTRLAGGAVAGRTTVWCPECQRSAA